jgi:arylsulfatase
MRWPARIVDPGAIRHQFCHAIDVTPTILEAAGVASPAVVAGVAQMPMHGSSLIPTLAEPAAARTGRSQYFEMLGHRGLWSDGWKAVTHHVGGTPFDKDDWELYHLDVDFSETDNLAAPDRLARMIASWWREAEANGVTPLDDRGAFELFRASRRPGLPTSRHRFVYHPPISHIVSDACPPAFRGWRTVIDLDHPEGAEGALVSRGSLNSGYVIYVRAGRCIFDFNAFHDHTVVSAPLPPGSRRIDLRVDRMPDGSGRISLGVDGETPATGAIARMLLIVSSLGMDIGRSPRPVCPDYRPPFVYPGAIRRVVFELPDAPAPVARAAAQAEVAAALARQ